MHRRQIFRTLVFLLMGLTLVQSPLWAHAVSTDVFREFEKKLGVMEVELKNEKEITKRYDIFLKHYREISDLRKKNPRQAEEKELNMSLYMSTLSFLPEKKDFKALKCEEYKKEVHMMMKSYDKNQKEPFVDRALKVVELICR